MCVADDIRYLIEADGELVIPKVSQQHEGLYNCRKNVPGETQEDYVSYLRIACKSNHVTHADLQLRKLNYILIAPCTNNLLYRS
jgi:hypothetical protein